MTTSPQDELYRRYLGILGWVGDPGLHELVSSHLIKVPYENVTQLIASAGAGASSELQPIGAFLDGIAERDLGGGDFTIPIHFASLLQFLDYEVELLGGGRLIQLVDENGDSPLRLRVRSVPKMVGRFVCVFCRTAGGLRIAR